MGRLQIRMEVDPDQGNRLAADRTGVELQKDSKTGNQYAELVAGQAGTAIYQDIATIPGVSYR